MNENKANILLIGNSGVGKSTLINAVLDENVAKTTLGDQGTENLDIYDSDALPFRLIDSKGMEYGALSQAHAKKKISKWMKASFGEENMDKSVSMIWYCVDSMAARLFSDNIKLLKSVTKFWKDIPVIVVLTKAYSSMEQSQNEEMVQRKIEQYGKGKINVKGIISVVAQEMPIDETKTVPSSGLDALIEQTAHLIPDTLQMAPVAIYNYKLRQKRKTAHGYTATVTAGATVIGGVPIPVADALVLVPMQTFLVQGIAKIYGISVKDSNLIKTIVDCGTISIPARAAVSSLKALFPGVGNAINAIVAAVFSGAIGEITIAVMDKIYTGEISENDLDWVQKYTESEFKKVIDAKLPMLKDIEQIDLTDYKIIGKFVAGLFEKNPSIIKNQK